MKKDIQVVRDSIAKVVGLLTKSSIKVTQRGMQAFVEYHPKTGAIQSLNVPYLPDDASEEFIASIQGFIDHEVGHVLYSDPAVLREAAKAGGRVMSMANLVEDVYVERMMSKAFAGSSGTLGSLRTFFARHMLLPGIKEALTDGDEKKALGIAMVIGFRAMGGQTMMADVMKAEPEVTRLFQPIADKLGEELLGKLATTKNSKECLELSRLICKRLEEPKEPAAPEKESADADDASKSKPSDAKKKGKDSKKGKGKPEEPPSDDVPPDPSDCEPPVEESGVADPSDEQPDGDDDAGPADPADPSESGDASERAETDTSDKRRPDGPSETDMAAEEGGSAGGDGDDTPDDGDSAGDRGERGSEDEGDLDDGTGGAGTGERGEGESPDDDGEGDGSSDREGAGGERSPSSDGDAPSSDGDLDEDAHASESEPDPAVRDALDALEDIEDFDKAVSRELSKKGAEEARDSRYVNFSNDWDKVEPLNIRASSAAIDAMVDKIAPMVGPLQKQLERAVAAQDKKAWESGLRRGKVNPSALFRTGFGDDRLFRRRHETKAKNTVVSLVVDCSGSMSWSGRIGVAGEAAYALSSTLERLRIRHEVIGFTTKESPAMMRAMKDDARVTGVSYARYEALYMPIFKGFGERLAGTPIARIAHLTEHSARDLLKENVDGECVQIAHHRLMQQRADKHIMIVLSDGSPACPGDRRAQDRHLKDVVKKIEASGTTVVGIGIQTGEVKDYYKRSVVLRSLADLPTTVVKELSTAILA